nr:DUF6063 family protein [uncultured Desulfuromonas sp.]
MDYGDIRNAAELIGFALRKPVVNPNRSGGSYSELINSFHASSEFAEIVQSIAAGLGLKILDANDNGLFLAATSEDSPFRAKLESINTSLLSADLRQIFGLALTTIAAIYYQTSTSLLEDMAPSTTVYQVREELLNIARARLEDIQNGDEDYSDIDEACRVILNLPVTSSTEKGGQKNNTLTRWIQKAFDFLKDEGFVKDRGSGEYTAYSRFRVHMREFMALEAYETVSNLLKRQELQRLEKQGEDHAPA